MLAVFAVLFASSLASGVLVIAFETTLPPASRVVSPGKDFDVAG